MKTLTLRKITLSLVLLLAVTLSYGTEKNDKKEVSETINYENYFNSDIDFTLPEELAGNAQVVKIYDQKNQLVMKGTEENTQIKKMIDISDLLIETDGTKLYRLSY